MEVSEKYLEFGKKLGLEGTELRDYVFTSVKGEQEREKEARELVLENEREKRARERELKKLELESVVKEKELNAMLMEKEIELEYAKKGGSSALGPKGGSKMIAKLPKLPSFDEKHDRMDAYLKRFERFAVNANWDKGCWATNLSALLQGRSLDVYSRLSPAESVEYDSLKEALLQRFQLTEEGFRSKFRTSRPEDGETPQQFVVRLEEYLTRWMDMAKVPESFEGLKDLLLREQFLQVSSKNLQIFLKEHKVSCVEELTRLAQQYQEAHEINTGSFNKGRNIPTSDTRRPQGKPQPFVQNDRERRCFQCNSSAHVIRDCPQLKTGHKAAAITPAETNQRGGRFMGRGRYPGRGGHRGSFGPRRGYYQNHQGPENPDQQQLGNLVVEMNPKVDSLESEAITLVSGQRLPFMTAACRDDQNKKATRNMPVTAGYMNDQQVDVLRDSGCSGVVVRRSLVNAECMTGKNQMCILVDGTVRRFPIAKIYVDTPFFTGHVNALCAERPVYDLIIGNIPDVRDASNPDPNWKPIESEGVGTISEDQQDPDLGGAVQTRAQKVKEGKTLKSLKVASPIVGTQIEDLKEAQETDSSLSKVRELVQNGEHVRGKKDSTFWYEKEKGIIYRYFSSPKVDNGKLFKLLVVPSNLRDQVMKLAHDSILGGHLGVRKTISKIIAEFYWPSVHSDVSKYCRSCDICQKTMAKGRVTKVPIGELPLIDTPFERVAIDLVGPIFPASEKGHRYFLTMVDFATRYPEATALKRIDTETVAEALVEMFSRVGFPKEILSDLGTQFTSDLMKEVSRLLSIKQLTTSPYNPACNGLAEKFNGSLKSMLKKMCAEEPKQWDRFIAPLLFAYREAPQESTGFSPFELLYGRTVRGPLMILKELWTNEIESDEVKTTYEYVLDLRNRLEETVKLAQTELAKSKARYKYYADLKRKPRQIKVGEKVLVLLPTDKNKLLMQLKGPFPVTRKINDFDYKVLVKGKEKIYHINLLRKYVERHQNEEEEGEGETDTDEEEMGAIESVCVAVIEETDGNLPGSEVSEDTSLEPNSPDEYCRRQMKVELPSLEAKETIADVNINPELTEKQRGELLQLLQQYPDVLTDIPGDTNLAEHDIKLTSTEPVRSRPYPVPHAMRETVKEEIRKMLDMGIIYRVDSPYASPIVIVQKPGQKSSRFCIDYRKLNKITVFDSEPIGNADDIFAKLSKSKYLSKLDLAKGYWQIPVKEEYQKYTAFISTEGLFAFRKMPFGMVNAGATFCRMMRKLLQGMKEIENFVDDIIEHTEEWDVHLTVLRELLDRLRKARLTVKPSKCMFGYFQLTFLGHLVGKSCLKPIGEKVEAIKNCSPPSTKKQVRSFLGLIGYYRKFIPNFSTLAVPLTDLTKKGSPNKIVWTLELERSFRTLVSALVKSPILCLPDIEKPFILRTDASDVGIGAVLLQEHEGTKFPISYASRKLLDREKAYSVIEKECLGVIWGIQKFQVFLYGREFLLETDHQPLVYLNRSKVANARLMRWALALQMYKFRIVSIKGSENVAADFLSRHA